MRIQNSITDRRFQMASKASHNRPHHQVRIAASRDVLRQRFEELMGRAEQSVARHPGVCFGAALAAGVILGWLIKRK